MGGCAARPRGHAVAPVIMRISSGISDSSSEMIEQKNLESYYLFWLDQTARSPEFIESRDELRSIINYLKIFERNTECVKEFGKITNGKIFLIVTCVQGVSLLPFIHNHKHLHSIYLYHHGDNVDTEQVSSQYKKIRGVYDSFLMAKRYLEDDVGIHANLDDPIVMDLTEQMNDIEYQEKFTLFLRAVNADRKDVYDKQTRKRLIEICGEYYAGNSEETVFLETFSLSYQSKQAISWYMRESCLHRLLSHAFIEHDMSLLVDMYSFIVDINQNLQEQCIKQPSVLRVFRGQMISNEKLAILKTNINQILTMQCFLKAQTSRDSSLRLLQSIEPNETTETRILFEIDVSQDYTIVDGDNSSTSKTVLFMLGVTFKIMNVTETTVFLSQYPSRLNNTHSLANESSLVLRGILTYLQDGLAEAIEYFEAILRNQSSIDLTTYSSIYGQLGYLKQKSGNLNVATQMYEQSMKYGTMQLGLQLFYLDQAAQYHATVLGNWEKANALWLQKLQIQNASLSDEEKAQTYENLARAAIEMKQTAKIVDYTSAAINNLPNDHPRLPFLRQQLESAQKS